MKGVPIFIPQDPLQVVNITRLVIRPLRLGTIYDYSFRVWPDETWDFNAAVYDFFRMLAGRIEMTFTPEDFDKFRSVLSHHGLTLREVQRVPYVEPEPVT